MAEIHMRHLHTKFLVTEADATLGGVGRLVGQIPAGKRADWYVVVRLADGGYAVLSLPDLLQALETHGDDSLSRPLSTLPDLLVPGRAVDRRAYGVGRARQEMRRSYKRRLVVLEDGAPVGLLVDEQRAGGLGGDLVTLFGEEQARHDVSAVPAKVRCPVDGEVYDFAQVVDLATGQLICPNGHVIER